MIKTMNVKRFFALFSAVVGIFVLVLSLEPMASLRAQEADPEAHAIPQEASKDANVAVQNNEANSKTADLATVTAIDKFDIQIADPANREHWEKTTKFDPPTIASYTDNRSGSRIDVLATKVVRAQYARALFIAFEEQLLKADFKVASEGKVQMAGDLQGTLTEYDYSEAKIMLRTMIFSFHSGSNAFLVVGYFSRAEASVMRSEFIDFIAHFKLKALELPAEEKK